MFIDNFLHAAALFKLTSILYLVSSLAIMLSFMVKKRGFTRFALLILLFAFISNTTLIVTMWLDAGRPPFKSLYETMIFYPWCVTFVIFILLALYGLTNLGIFSSLISLIRFAYACYKPDIEIINMPPALQSGWFVPHVITYFIAYAGLLAAFSLAILYLILPNW